MVLLELCMGILYYFFNIVYWVIDILFDVCELCE